MIDPTAVIHPQAHVHEDCEIGPRTRVFQFASVVRGSRIGADCIVSPGALFDGSKCGDGSTLGPNLVAGHGFLVGNGCFVGPNVTLCNDIWPRAHKQGFSIEEIELLNRYGEWAVIVDDGASIGANAAIMPGVIVGKGAMVAAGAVVTRNVPAGHLYLRSDESLPIRNEDRARMRFVHDEQHPARR